MRRKKCAFFVDFSCVFDLIPRNSLFFKLSLLGISSKFLSVLALLYKNTSSQVWDGNCLSDPFCVLQGVKQVF